MKKLNKRNCVILGGLIVLLIVFITCIVIMINRKESVQFYVNKKEVSSYATKIEYKKGLVLNQKTLKVSAMFEGKDISTDMEVVEIEATELKEYKIVFKIKGKEDSLTCKVKVVDTTAPVVAGKDVYEVSKGSTFTKDQLSLEIDDNYDQDVRDNVSMENVDTSKVGEQKINVTVHDSHNNKTTYQITVHVVDGAVSSGNTSTNVVSNPNDITVLINKQHRLPDGWAPNDLVSIGGGHSLRSEAAAGWNALNAAATADGLSIRVISTFRTQQYQQSLYDHYYAQDPEGAPFYSAIARTSEHESGLAIDISYDAYLHDDLQNSEIGKWMYANAHQFGFIVRYPQDKTNITQYMFEPWHYRYVGVDLAKKLHKSGLTLEEYYQ